MQFYVVSAVVPEVTQDEGYTQFIKYMEDGAKMDKFEGFELFKKFIAKVNQDTVSFLTKCLIPIQNANQVEEAKKRKESNKYDTNKEESRSLLTGNKTQQVEKTKPIRSEKVFG